MPASASKTQRRERELFNAALELPPARRAAYLKRACAGDITLRKRVEALLRVQAEAEGFFDPKAVPPNSPKLAGPDQPANRPRIP